ncbi:MAG: gluconate 2-dehydrogenase subunit 3 family protein [Balneolaceae bacterium]
MKRRDAIKTLLMASGGVLALPSWAMNWKRQDIPDYDSSFNELELRLISSIADTIIPSNGEIGALSVGVDKFLAGLISKCYEEDFRDDIKKCLHQLQSSANSMHNLSFFDCEQADRESIFLAMNNDINENEEAFFSFMKSQTIRGFETSEEVLVNYHNYQLMPGFYDGNVDVEI